MNKPLPSATVNANASYLLMWILEICKYWKLMSARAISWHSNKISPKVIGTGSLYLVAHALNSIVSQKHCIVTDVEILTRISDVASN